MDNEKENQAMPEDDFEKSEEIGKAEKKKKESKVKIKSLSARNEERREYKDAIYYEKISETKPDITKPLKKGSIDMW